MRRHSGNPPGRGRPVAVAAIAALAVAGFPANAAAADNNPPSRPLVAELSTGHEDCVNGPGRPHVRTLPQLRAVLRDPDAAPTLTVPLTAEFELSWKDAEGGRQEQTLAVDTAKSSGSVFQRTAPSGLPAHTVIDWRVRAHDGTEWGEWSSSGGQSSCQFVYDNDPPESPTVSSNDYPDDDAWHPGVGDYGRFTFDGPSDDTVSYSYSFMGEAWKTTPAAHPGDPVTVSWLPDSEGPVTLAVQAVDPAGNTSNPSNYTFRVGGGRTPAAHWPLDDPAGSGEASAEAGGHSATAGEGAAFGAPGPSGTGITSSVALDGSAGAYLSSSATAVDSSLPFAATAWVRPVSLEQDMTAVSQDGASGDPVALGLEAGESGPSWSFELSTGSGTVRVHGGVPAADRWTHLAGVYDPVAHTAELYVNGRPAGSAQDVTATATGALQIGRIEGGDAHTGNWNGMLAEVRLWDRIVLQEELTGLAHRDAARTGYWQLNDAQDGRSPEYAGGQDLVLGGDATVPPPNCDSGDSPCLSGALVGPGHLRLDGDGDYAATEEPVVDSDGSFTLAARVRLDEDSPTRDMTVLSLPGEHANTVTLRYSADSWNWELAVTAKDEANAEVTAIEGFAWPSESAGQHIAVAHDATNGTLKLYVDGSLRATTEADLWSSTGGLQIGRSLGPDGWDGHLRGAVDEVRAYAGALTSTQISRISISGEQPDL